MKRLNEFMEEQFGSSWQLGLLLVVVIIVIGAAAVVTAVAVYEELIEPLLETVLTPH